MRVMTGTHLDIAASIVASVCRQIGGPMPDWIVTRGCVIISALLLSGAYAAAAETTWDILERFGLAGVWSTSCAQLATPKSFRTIFSKGTDGLAVREIDYGAGFPIRVTIVESAQMISPLKLKIRVRNTDPNWGQAE
jgi:hypothetical protein